MNQLNEKFHNTFNIEVDFVKYPENLITNETLVEISKNLKIYDKKQNKVIYSNIFMNEDEDSLNKDIQDEVMNMYDLWLKIKGSYYDFLFNMEIERLKINN